MILMAQGDSQSLVRTFTLLNEEDQRVIAEEMALTGCADQRYECDTSLDSRTVGKGPAILVYYGPAFLQKNHRTDPKISLQILAEIFRQARDFWPLCAEEGDKTVVVRIDAFKDLSVESILTPASGYSYILAKTSGQDAAIRLMPISSFKRLDWSENSILSFSAGTRTGLLIGRATSLRHRVGKSRSRTRSGSGPGLRVPSIAFPQFLSRLTRASPRGPRDQAKTN